MPMEAILMIRCESRYAFFLSENVKLYNPLCVSITPLAAKDFEEFVSKAVKNNTGFAAEKYGIVAIEIGNDEDTTFSTRLIVLVEFSKNTVHQEMVDVLQVKWLKSGELTEQENMADPNVAQKWIDLCEHSKGSLSLDAVMNLSQPIKPLIQTSVVSGSMFTSEGDNLENQQKYEEMLKMCNYGPVLLSQIASEFTARCGKGIKHMSKAVFSPLFTKLGVPEDKIDDLYRALNGNGLGLRLIQLQVALAAMDPLTPHGGIAGQMRTKFIFHFYNKSGTGIMTFEEFCQLAKDIYEGKRISLDKESVEKISKEQFSKFTLKSGGITLQQFLASVGQLHFRGTSVLLRLPKPLFGHNHLTSIEDHPPSSPVPLPDKYHDLQDSDSVRGSTQHPTVTPPALPASRGKKTVGALPHVPEDMEISDSSNAHPKDDKGSKSNEKKNDYSIATHFVKVRRSGLLVDVSSLWDFISTDAVTGSVRNILSHSKPGMQRQGSIFTFDPKSVANQMLGLIRYFEQSLAKENGQDEDKRSYNWGNVELPMVAKTFMNMCTLVQDILASEDRLVDVPSPAYVLGDFHGNFQDLICFEKVLWRMGPSLTPASFIFLGDYVDRGPYGFEVIAYLFAQKVLSRQKMVLIRGNHELRDMQVNFSFQSECIDKFGEALGLRIWETANQCFDVMPVAAVVDKKIFCSHGGIPRPCLGGGLLSTIRDVPVVLHDPEIQSPLAWELLWSDPVRGEENLSKEVKEELQRNDGFLPNDSRGTGYRFSTAALEAFLYRNKLSHVIRAHEVKSTGFQLQQKGRLLTVFSSSRYCGGTNEAACVLIDLFKIRTIQLDTT